MQKDSRAKKLNTYPVVVMYSYYIPCSMSDHVCAKRLANDTRNRETKYSLVVGYSDYYIYQQRHKNPKDLTIKNIQDSFKTFRDGTIDVYYLIRDFSKQLSVIVLLDTMSDIFQSNLYNCLVKQPLVYCCSANLDQGGVQVDVNNTWRIVTFSINSMIHNCSSLLSSKRFLVQKMKGCFDKWIDNNIGPDCQTCASGLYGRQELIDFTKSCIWQTWEFSKYVGALDDPYRLDNPSWKHAPIVWTVTPAGFQKNNALYCYNRLLRPDSFCTKTEQLDESRLKRLKSEGRETRDQWRMSNKRLRLRLMGS